MRYDQSMRALKTLLDRGDLGEAVLATIEMRAIPHWQAFLKDSPRLTLQNMSIHHLDAFRFLLGDPDGIFVSARTDPRTTFEHRDGIVLYDPGVRQRDPRERLGRRLDRSGARGIRGRHLHQVARRGDRGPGLGHDRLALLPDADARRRSPGRPRNQPGYVFQPRWPEVWFPDAFAGTMGALLDALGGGPNLLDGRDNLKTMAMIEAGYRSLDEKRVVRIEEITG